MAKWSNMTNVTFDEIQAGASARTPPHFATAFAATPPGWAWELDPAANAGGGPRISRAGSRVAAWVIPTNEELRIAQHTRQVLAMRRFEIPVATSC